MRYYIVAGEASGDLHGSNLMKELKHQDSNAEFRFFGGDLMKAVGGELVNHYKDTAFMGFIPVILNLRTILKNIKKCQEDVLSFKPDVLILIDYPGFNLKIAKFAFEHGFKVHYYISPKIWAWKERRIKDIKAYVHKMITILPFETEFYRKHGMEVNYVGNPLFDQISAFKKTASVIETEKPILAVLPGSRKMELERMLPTMAKAAKLLEHEYQVYIAATPDFDISFYKSLIGDLEAQFVVGETYRLLNSAQRAIITSGTATLEAAIFKVPQVICYHGPALVVAAARRFVKVKYLGLANLIMDKAIVKELIQEDMTPERIVSELSKFNTRKGAEKIEKDYNDLLDLLGGEGASKRAAEIIINDIK
tara:strand:- start:1811 stop:2905 length:1095 start_codon:yes stop_codon:yes gene_type:complete